MLTEQNTQQYIHDKLIEKVEEKLSVTNLSVSEIAYELGFEHLQSLSKLFKTKITLSPLEFRRSFNWLKKTKADKSLCCQQDIYPTIKFDNSKIVNKSGIKHIQKV